MSTSMIFKKVLTIVACIMLLTLSSIPRALCQVKPPDTDTPSSYNQRGLDFFKKGFYEHAPQKKAAEAELNYRLAIKEFKAAIAKDSSYADAHRNLARVYYVQKNFEDAAWEYRKVTELAPGDLDSYVNLALAYIELKEFNEAVDVLENAKEQTSDPKILNTLNGYITKIRNHQAKGVR